MRDFNSESQSVYDGFESGLFWKGVWLWIATKSNSESQSVYDRFWIRTSGERCGYGLPQNLIPNPNLYMTGLDPDFWREVWLWTATRYIPPPPHVREIISNSRVLISDVLKSI
jgi:hypothetical protein